MEESKYFIIIVVIFAFFGIIISVFKNNNILKSNQLNNIDNYDSYDEEDLLSLIKEKEKMLDKVGKENKVILEKEIDLLYENIKKIEENRIKKITRKDGKLTLSCSYSLDNGYLYPTLVAMTSLVENKGKNTFYDIYVLISPDFKEKNKDILKSVETRHPEDCKIIFIQMADQYKGKDTNSDIPLASYYRLELHNLLPDVDRIIYMDGDTIVFQDLSELITLDMKGNYILGFLDDKVNELEKFNIKNGIFVCAGVILMNLHALRKNNFSLRFNDFLEVNIGNLYQHDQTTINVVCQGKISTLPPKYGMWNFKNRKTALEHNDKQSSKVKYIEKDFLYSYYNPAILHYVCNKPFKKRVNNRTFHEEWWEYANKTGYYDEIYKNTNKSLYLKISICLLNILISILF